MLKNDSFSFNLGKSRAKTRRERYDLKKSISEKQKLNRRYCE